MCGIAGQVNFTKPIVEADINAMNDALRHRGPDGSGIYINEPQTVGMGHRRLSFLDLSEAGKQPMSANDGKIWITYNGEIYNYVELRAELESKGYQFKSHTDTEVILHGYVAWGYEVLNRLKGMFAFGIWDESKKELFLARDRFGIKPLYYYNQNGNFVFASEIKGIKANTTVTTTLDIASFADYFVYRYVPSPKSIWREVKKLPVASYLILKSDGSSIVKQYWKIPYAEKMVSDKDAIGKFDALLLNSVKTHARSDVPVGSFLSGGYDSSAIVYYMSRFGYVPSTFAIGFQDWDVSEHLYADMVAKQYHTDHHSLMLQSQSLDIIDHLVWVYDEPNGDISTIPTYLISKEAAKTVKAVMSGEGSDEFLVGYQWQKEYKPANLTLLQQFRSTFKPKATPHIMQYYAHAMAMGRFDSLELQKLLHPDLHQQINANPDWYYQSLYNPSLTDLKAIQVMDIKHFMGEQVLAKVDRASMANSLEVRVPFLDHEICEFIFQLKQDVYYRKSETKHLLYQNIKGHLPDEILNRKKQGFVGPDRYYMNMPWYQSRLTDSKLVKDGIVNAAYIQQLLTTEDHWRLWKVAVMEAWYKNGVEAVVIFAFNEVKYCMRAVFKNNELEQHLATHGYCLVRLLQPTDVAKLEKVYYGNKVEDQPAIERTTSSTNQQLAQNIKQQAGEIISQHLNDVLLNYRLFFSGFITKNPGKPSKMRLHQDPTFVDESQFKALNIWVPLIDVDENNGAVWIIPNSDKFFKGFRGQPAREFDFDSISVEVMNKMGKAIPMKAGEALIYDTSLFHFSLENTSGKVRIASTTVMVPQEAAPIYYHHNKALNTLDVYEVGDDFLLRYYSEYLKTGVVEEKLVSRMPYTEPKKVGIAEFEERYRLYNQPAQ